MICRDFRVRGKGTLGGSGRGDNHIPVSIASKNMRSVESTGPQDIYLATSWGNKRVRTPPPPPRPADII